MGRFPMPERLESQLHVDGAPVSGALIVQVAELQRVEEFNNLFMDLVAGEAGESMMRLPAAGEEYYRIKLLGHADRSLAWIVVMKDGAYLETRQLHEEDWIDDPDGQLWHFLKGE